MDEQPVWVSAPGKPARPRRRRWLLFGGLVLVLLGLGAYAWYCYVTFHSDRDVAEAISEADRLDPGWQLVELEAKRVRIPDAENSALRVQAAKRLLPSPWPAPPPPLAGGDPEEPPRSLEERIFELPPEVVLNEELAKELRAELERAAPALAEARSLSSVTRGRYAITYALNFVYTVLSCQDARAIGTLLRLDAARRARDGDIDGALTSGQAIVNAGRSIGDEPIMISQLVRISCQAVAFDSIERSLAQGQPSETSLQSAQRLLEEEAEQPLLLIAVRGERAGTHRMLTAIRTGELPCSQLAGPAPVSVASRLEDLSGAWAMKHVHAPYLRILSEAVEIAKLPVEQQAARLKALNDPSKKPPVLAALWLPANTKMATAYQRSQALLRCAFTALAVERYRIRHGRWPNALADLKGAGLLQQVPLDPYDGAPLRFCRREDGIVVYSIGPDGKDDGGRLNRKDMTAEGSDLGFQLWELPRRRRQPPKAVP